MEKSKLYIMIAILYVLSFVFGYWVASLFQLDLWLEILVIDLAATLFIYGISLFIDNASLYDPYWSVYPPILLFYAMLKLNHFSYLNLLMVGLITLWAIRLTYNWAINFTSFKHQDWRYDLLKSKTRAWYPLINLVGIQLMPTLIVYAQILVGIHIIALNATLNISHVIPSLMILSAVYIQHTADKQMRLFRNNPNKKGVMSEGIWSISRHPNYFGEIMVWTGLYLFYFLTTFKLDILILSPVVMALLFLSISIPMMETKMMAKYEDYKIYQNKTSKLIPWFTKTPKLNEE